MSEYANPIVETEPKSLNKVCAKKPNVKGVSSNPSGEVLTEPKENIVNIITVEEVKELIRQNNLWLLPRMGYRIVKVEELPATGENGVLYFLPIEGGETPNLYEEYVWNNIDSEFELLGTTEIDLSGYVKKDEMPHLTQAEYDEIVNKQQIYYFIEEED